MYILITNGSNIFNVNSLNKKNTTIFKKSKQIMFGAYFIFAPMWNGIFVAITQT